MIYYSKNFITTTNIRHLVVDALGDIDNIFIIIRIFFNFFIIKMRLRFSLYTKEHFFALTYAFQSEIIVRSSALLFRNDKYYKNYSLR